MNEQPTTRGPVAPSLIRLQHDNARSVLALPPAEEERAFQPFLLPPFPLSQHCFLTGLAAEFNRLHQRCLAMLLVLECQQRRWVKPMIPAQACGRDKSSWTTDLDESSNYWPPHRRIGGTFQTRRRVHCIDDALEAVPEMDGLHLIQSIDFDEPVIYCMVRCGGQTTVAASRGVVADDFQQALTEAASRLRFE